MARSDCKICAGRGTVVLWAEEPGQRGYQTFAEASRAGPPTPTKRVYACPECCGDSPGVEIVEASTVIDKLALMAVRSEEELIAGIAVTTAHRLLESLIASGKVLVTVEESGTKDQATLTVSLAAASKHAADTAQRRADEIYRKGAFDAVNSMVVLIEALTPLHTAAGIVLREAEGGTPRGRRSVLRRAEQ